MTKDTPTGLENPKEISQILRRLSLRQLIYFVELERHMNFGRAAEAVGISQPTLSQQIAQLENSLHISLLNRTTRGFELTEAGKLFLIQSTALLEDLGMTIAQLHKGFADTSLRIGLPSHQSYPLLANILSDFRVSFPSVHAEFNEMTAVEMCAQLQRGNLEAGFMSLPIPFDLSSPFEQVTVWSEHYELCLSKSNPLSEKAALTPTDLQSLEFILMPRAYHERLYDFQIEALRDLGCDHPKIVQSGVANATSQIGLTSAGLGVCLICPESVQLSDDVVLRPTIPPLRENKLALFWRKQHQNPLLERFVALVRKFEKL